MSLYGQEFIAHERQKDFLQEAERMRLISALEHQRSNEQKHFQKVANWLGSQLVEWGLKLQSFYGPDTPTQVRAAGAVDIECPQC